MSNITTLGQDLAQVDIATFATKLTLDAVGESTFGHKFDALEGGTDDLFRANKRASAITQNLTEFGLLFRAIQRHMPLSVSTRLFTMFPTDEVRRLKAAGDTRRATARDILMTAKQSGSASREENKDILSVLIMIRKKQSSACRMRKLLLKLRSVVRFWRQYPWLNLFGRTIMQAGHHVTGVSMAWLFYDLATHPEDQQRVFNELNALRTQRGPGMELTASDYDAMPYFNAVIKESLRLHSVAPLMIREATFDDSIPLTTPVASTTGEEFSQIPVKKGQRVMLDFTSYHWLEDVWGTDAHTWNPSRFLDPEMKKNQVNVGVYSNLLIFSGGVQGCIGWRFALMEIQTMLAAVLERFEISIPDGVEIQGVRTAPVVPMVVGKLDDGMQVPVMMRRRGDTGGHS
ncbi:hypothetical protein VNI00_000799 [Paramarasmius palmivorus]|uniref:Cytochrome P450 n=1 Tax=Paramarasmius palmivorus TaxID=297713 RepID=A0AAW0E9Z1_9AGAR